MQPLISIIIPIYNVEKYIEQCLESVRGQTLHDYEAILVNDGSNDNSAVYAQAFIEKYSLTNYILIDKENGGICSARNTGLAHASGRWIYFLDSDDWLEPNALEDLASCIEIGVDLVIGGYQAYDDSTAVAQIWSEYPIIKGVLPQDLPHLHSFSFVWSRLYKRSIISKYNLQFDERIKYAEDNAWQFDYNRYVKTYVCTNKVGYNYRINRVGSLTSGLVTPRMKYDIYEHMFGFYETLEDDLISKSLRSNPRLLSVTWAVLTTAVINDILDDQIKNAKEKRKSSLSRWLTEAFHPRSKKEKFFFWFWKHSFVLLRGFVCVYYKNFDYYRRCKFVRFISKRK